VPTARMRRDGPIFHGSSQLIAHRMRARMSRHSPAPALLQSDQYLYDTDPERRVSIVVTTYFLGGTGGDGMAICGSWPLGHLVAVETSSFYKYSRSTLRVSLGLAHDNTPMLFGPSARRRKVPHLRIAYREYRLVKATQSRIPLDQE